MIAQRARAVKSNKKLVGMLICIASIFCFVSLFAPPLSFVGDFFKGTFGVFGFVLFAAMFFVGMMFFKKYEYVFDRRFNVLRTIIIISFISVLQLIFCSGIMKSSLSAYTENVFNKITPGGIVLGLPAFLISKLVYTAGAYVFFILTTVVAIALIIDYRYARTQFSRLSSAKTHRNANYIDAQSGEVLQKGKISSSAEIQNDKPVLITLNGRAAPSPKPAVTPSQNSEPTKKISTAEEALLKLGIKKNAEESSKNNSLNKKLRDYILTPSTVQTAPIIKGDEQKTEDAQILKQKQEEAVKDFMNAIKPVKRVYDVSAEETLKQNYNAPRNIESGRDFVRTSSDVTGGEVKETPAIEPEKHFGEQFRINAEPSRVIERKFERTEEQTEKPQPVKPTITEEVGDIEERINNLINTNTFEEQPTKNLEVEAKSVLQTADDDVFPEEALQEFPEEISQEVPEEIVPQSEEPVKTEIVESELVREFKQKWQTGVQKPVQESMLSDSKDKKKEAPKFTISPNTHYHRPPIELLRDVVPSPDDETQEQLYARAEALEAVLDNFKVPAKVTDIIKGPTVTRYELQMPPGKTVKLIQSYASDIAMALAIKGRIRVEAPIPGKSAVGIEVPNNKTSMIGVREIITSSEFQKGSPLTFALGKDVTGAQTMVCDLMDMPHLLIAGSTGSGKSVCLNVLICSLLYKMSPEDLRIILIDPKRVEFTSYSGLPHLIIPEPIIEPKDAINALIWVIEEMERRYTLFHSMGVNHIIEYNNREKIKNGQEAKLPIILVVIDELADLITTSRKDVEERIRRITALARASGIHLVVATQRPSADVITGTIKVNLPSRIAFQVTNWVDSKTILDQNGAEDLVGKGDMLYAPRSFPDPKRVQCAYISLDEVKSVVSYIKENNEAYFDENIKNDILKKVEEKPVVDIDENSDDRPELDKDFYKALKLVVETRSASVSLLQRRFSFGYSRAARIIDQMEQQRFISPQDDNKSKPRSVYLTLEEFNSIFPGGES